MRICFTISVLFIHLFAAGQTSFLKEAVSKLDRALVQKDTVTLKQLLHKNVTYGHSTGWVQTREDIIRDLASGKLVYYTIKADSLTWKTEPNWASVRSRTKSEVLINGNRVELNLHVLAVWLKTNKGWQLIARQSTRL